MSPRRCLWKWLYADEYGVINFLLMHLRPVARPMQWLANPDMAMASVIVGPDLEAHAGHVHRPARRAAERAEGTARGGGARRRRPRPALPLRHVSGHPADQHHHHPAGLDLDVPGIRHRLPADRRRTRRRDGDPADADLPEGLLGLRDRLRRGARDARCSSALSSSASPISSSIARKARTARRARWPQTASAIAASAAARERLDYRKAFGLLVDLRAAARRGDGHPLPGLLDGFLVAEARPRSFSRAT